MANFLVASRALIAVLAFCALAAAGDAAPRQDASPRATSPSEADLPPGPSRLWTAHSAYHEVRDFRFHDGSSMPKIRLHYRTLGKAHRDAQGRIDNAILLLHATGHSSTEFLSSSFADPLFAPGKPLDASRYWIVMPDSIGHGLSSRPSDGMRTHFPHYDYADMIALQHAVVHDGLGIERLRLILGTSMGCMHTYLWGTTYPAETRALMAMSCTPFPVGGMNWYWRKALIDAITTDPAWDHGNYKAQPRVGLRNASAFAAIALSGAPNLAAHDPSQDSINHLIDEQGAKAVETLDANDMIYQFSASTGYDAWSRIDRIRMPVLWWDSADDFINPTTLPYPQQVLRRMPNFQYKLQPAGPDTYGHMTFEHAHFFAADVAKLLERSER